ncbi:hypothetical protein ACHAWF_011292 [Thalassiosira exigua]
MPSPSSRTPDASPSRRRRPSSVAAAAALLSVALLVLASSATAFSLGSICGAAPRASFAISSAARAAPPASFRRRRRAAGALLLASAAPADPSGDASGDEASTSASVLVPLAALRSTLRAATGFSLTATRTALRAAAGISLSGALSSTLRRLLEILTPGLRYFVQPLLILYYVPLLTIRYWMVGPSDRYVDEGRKLHERAVEGWRNAVRASERAHEGGYWPVHVNEDGTIVGVRPPDPREWTDVADGIKRSVAEEAAKAESAGIER